MFNKIAISILIVSFIFGTSANCGCLQCCKNLRVVSAPFARCKVIYKDVPTSCRKPIPYTVQAPIIPPSLPPILKNHEYTIKVTPTCEEKETPCFYDLNIQAPIIPPPLPPKLLTGLYTLPERVVLPAPGCPKEADGPCVSIWPDVQTVSAQSLPELSYRPILEQIVEPCGCRYDIEQHEEREQQQQRLRRKREIPLFKNSIGFLLNLIPDFFKPFYGYDSKQKKPSLQTKLLRHRKQLTVKPLTYKTLVQKLRKLNQNDLDNYYYYRNSNNNRNRVKRAVLFGDGEIELPYLEVTEIDEDDDIDTDDDQDRHNRIDRNDDVITEQTYLEPLNFNHLLPHQHLFYLMNTPIRLLQHFHRFGEQIKPIFHTFPGIFIQSKRYLREFRRHFRKDLFDIASNLIGDFHEHRFVNKPLRYKRSPVITNIRYKRDSSNNPVITNNRYKRLFENNPVITNVRYKRQLGNNSVITNARYMRYILKIVDEDEIHEFLREKFDNLINYNNNNNNNNHNNNDDNKDNNDNREVKIPELRADKRRLVIKKLTPKIILDNNGRPFIEMNGNKRPLHLNFGSNGKQNGVKTINKSDDSVDNGDDIRVKIDDLMDRIKSKTTIINHNNNNNDNCDDNNDNYNDRRFLETEQSLQLIRERAQQVLIEIQELMALDLNNYLSIFNCLNKMENLKKSFIVNWENCLINSCNNNNLKLTLLNDIRELQQLKDEISLKIITILQNNDNNDNNTRFIINKLIKYLIRLQKLQCLINRIVEDYEQLLNNNNSSNNNGNNSKQMKIINYLKQLEFVNNNKSIEFDLIDNLNNERNRCIEDSLAFLDNLHKFLGYKQKTIDNNNHSKDSGGGDYNLFIFDFSRIIWQIKNNEKLQKNIINEMSIKLNNKQKIRKELRILFNLLHEFELAETNEKQLLNKWINNHNSRNNNNNNNHSNNKHKHHSSNNNNNQHSNNNNRGFSNIILDDKKPVKLVTNGYTIHAYKIADNF